MSNNENGKQKSLLVMDEIPISLLPYRFIESLIPSGKYVSQVFARWLKPIANDTYSGIDLLYTKYTYPDGKQVGLYCFPQAIGRNFGIEDYEAPIETIGIAVIMNTEDFLRPNRKVGEEHSAIHWATRYHLPIIIVVINSTGIERNTEKLSQFIDYSPDMSIVWCDGDMDLSCVQGVMDTIYPYV